MPQIRRLATTTAVVATLLLVFTSVAMAKGPQFGPHRFDDVWIGTAGADAYAAPDGSRDKLIGRAGDDVLEAGDRNDLVRGNTGDDELYGGDGRDKVNGGAGDDELYGGANPDRILGRTGDDYIDGGTGPDRIKAGAGNDTIVADDGQRDWIDCGPGEDTVTADSRDRIRRNCETVSRVSSDDEADAG